jgi:membrane protease YdiL (CAAX protease family)
MIDMMEKKENLKSYYLTIALTIVLGMSVTLIRIVMPLNVTITPWIVILEMALELAVCFAIIWLNRVELKEIFKAKLKKKDIDVISLGFIVAFCSNIAFSLIRNFIYFAATAVPYGTTSAGAAVVQRTFFKAFPIGVIITTSIIAPIWEEIVFRFTLRKLFKNTVLFVAVSSILFGFLHTGSIFDFEILEYILFGDIFCLLYLKTKDLRKVVAMHMVYNITINVMSLTAMIAGLINKG